MIYSARSEGDISDLSASVAQTVLALSSHTYEFDIIAVRGLSGQLVGIPASLILQKELVVIRKSDERGHSVINPGLLNAKENGRYIVLDDFMASGNTVATIVSEIERDRDDLRHVGNYMYEGNVYTPLVS